jgi:hypothetical protein
MHGLRRLVRFFLEFTGASSEFGPWTGSDECVRGAIELPDVFKML